MKILSPRLHGYLDYLTVLIFVLAPTLLGLTGVPAMLAYTLAGVHLAMTLLTNFPMGLVKLVPMPLHGWVERVVGPTLIAIPFLLGFSGDTKALSFYIAMGATIIVVGVVTDYQGVEAPAMG
ncbi:MAG TPA: hypothetical protein VH877_13070 [Polyangia bacterium]|jgi:hypothetical protein|nr:hypothetical protein [Polyangia bacterium]